MWWIFALLSAFFAALTAIFAKMGIKGVDTEEAWSLFYKSTLAINLIKS